MQGLKGSMLLVLAMLVGPAGSITAINALSPVSRCVKLLTDLSEKIEKEAKVEEGLFEDFICWGTKVVDTKTASNSAADSRIDMLKAYLADIAAGRVEFTSERQDLEKEIEELYADIEAAKAVRKQENSDFEEAKDEMDKAITALNGAIKVLDEATKDSKKSALFALRARVNEGFSERAAEGASLAHAVELGQKFLTTGDALFLRKLLTGEVPTADWKKLNRKATFKMSYKARSVKIQSVLAKLLSTFTGNLKEATDKEDKAQKTHDKLMKSKSDQKTKSEEALKKMEKEMGARGMSKEDASDEVKALELQVKNDKKFIADTQKAMSDKTSEWKERKKLRAGELEAISKTVAILNNDDAKDNFKKSFSSQGFLFLQESRRVSRANVAERARAQLIKAALRDSRVVELAEPLKEVTEGTHFDKVIASIDTMVKTLKEETETDMTNKEDCEKTRMEDTRESMEKSRAIDDNTDAIGSLKADIKGLKADKAETEQELKDATEEIKAAKKIRDAEAKEWLASDADDKEASETIASAKDTLSKFYEDNKLMLVQHASRQPAGEAPPPPPSTWEGGYGGKTGESTGIMGILDMIKADIDKDRAAAKSEELKAVQAYNDAHDSFLIQEAALKKAIGELEGTIGSKMGKVDDTEKERLNSKNSLDAVMKKISNADPGCNFLLVNYPMRLKNRNTEIDGLLKAKAILQGAAFTPPEDASREIKPGDALLQRLRRH